MQQEEYKKPTEFSFSKITPSESGFQPTEDESSKILKNISIEVTPRAKGSKFVKG